MNRYVLTGLIGIVCGILCAQADVPLAWSGRKEDPLNEMGMRSIQPWWRTVPTRHFDLSFWLSCLGQPGTYLTMWMLAELIGSRQEALGLALKINTFIGAYTGLLYHGTFCIKPLVYREICQEVSQETAERTMKVIERYPLIPSLISAASLFLGTTLLVGIAIWRGFLPVPRFLMLFNPVGAVPLTLLARKVGLKAGGAMGFGFSLFAIVLLVAGLSLG